MNSFSPPVNIWKDVYFYWSSGKHKLNHRVIPLITHWNGWNKKRRNILSWWECRIGVLIYYWWQCWKKYILYLHIYGSRYLYFIYITNIKGHIYKIKYLHKNHSNIIFNKSKLETMHIPQSSGMDKLLHIQKRNRRPQQQEWMHHYYMQQYE